MSRLELITPDQSQLVVECLYKNLEQRIESSPPGLCPVDISKAFFGNMSCTKLWKMCSMSRWTWTIEESY